MSYSPALSDATLTLSIEVRGVPTRLHPYHLGTDETLARKLAVEEFHRLVGRGEAVVTVALMRKRRIVDVWEGDGWSSDRDWT